MQTGDSSLTAGTQFDYLCDFAFASHSPMTPNCDPEFSP